MNYDVKSGFMALFWISLILVLVIVLGNALTLLSSARKSLYIPSGKEKSRDKKTDDSS
jgi:hypothetical protein